MDSIASLFDHVADACATMSVHHARQAATCAALATSVRAAFDRKDTSAANTLCNELFMAAVYVGSDAQLISLSRAAGELMIALHCI